MKRLGPNALVGLYVLAVLPNIDVGVIMPKLAVCPNDAAELVAPNPASELLAAIPTLELAPVTEPAVEAVLKAVLPVVAAPDDNPATPVPAFAAV